MNGVTLKEISRKYGSVVAVDDIELNILPGELFFLLGPSGCGKTTLLRMIAGFVQPDKGRIYFNDKLVVNVPANKRNTGMVFQNYALWPHMNVYKNVAYGLDERPVGWRDKKKRVLEALKMVRMEDKQKRNPAQLSGGEQQRVALARALVINPELVLLDEPLSNLDAGLRHQMRHEIRRIHDETGITMIYVTHDQKEALAMADRIAVMNNGRLEQIGTPAEIYQRPANRFVASFVGEMNSIGGRITSIDKDGVIVDTVLGKFKGVFRCEKASVGSEAVCMFRPESMKTRVITDNIIKAKLKRKTFMGEILELLLDADGHELKSILISGSPEWLDAGSVYEFGISSKDIQVFDA